MAEKKSQTTLRGEVEIGAGENAVVTNFALLFVPKGASVDDVTLDKVTRNKVIDGAIAELNENYVFADVAKKMEAAVRARQKHGDYDLMTDGYRFAESLTKDLRAVSHDKHLSVAFSPVHMPDARLGPTPSENRKELERTNCGFERVERFADNVGYLKFNVFADPAICGPTATAAMNFLANVDTLIIDLARMAAVLRRWSRSYPHICSRCQRI